ncbi:hypothetical protein N7499_008953 [Penicillium canescens]|uniref:RING-type domain-containing protein n=1 Tax=Penicillium canescens TaxID=5083 RepID=A0AAD6I0L9_PENCN|nr:uncharacterized protein N7446_013920 [Penicillium canescens]KAJ5984833.1 hypothetical protein N7522_012029 [Penicillium canescens]KAJ6023555.1 hypothetical protein N7460_013950 [Penicillium canescens]KAJ6025168.1 hypothetical protein N7444_012847 [Penicillium canescens]KAJ6042854.1 hypothetical protein N7446_013920 [Penicillium canescens]KAJ6076972.1 hypothetical protein N7499_008953 [Penicillium canescens]
MEESMPRGEIIGIVIGGVVIFALISMIPLTIIWCRRRVNRESSLNRGEWRLGNQQTQQLPLQDVLGHPVSVDRWLEEQNVPTNAQQYGQDTCSICLCALSSPVYPTYPHTAILARSQRNQSPIRADDPHARVALDPGHETIVLNRCKHAFHLACLKSWFEYRRYKCPICQASYSPEEEACGLRPPT